MQTIKEQARQLVEQLPEQATWDDLVDRIHLRRKIATGLQAIEDDRVQSHEVVKQMLLARCD